MRPADLNGHRRVCSRAASGTGVGLLAAPLILASLVLAFPLQSRASSPAGFYLTWGDCGGSAEASADRSGGCSSPGDESLYLAFVLSGALDSVIAIEATLEVQATAGLTAWWDYGPAGCRAGRLEAVGTFPPSRSCGDFWMGRSTSNGLQEYAPLSPGRSRIRIALAVLPQIYRRLEAGVVYGAARLVFHQEGGGACPGCEMPVSLVLDSLLVGRLPGAPGGDLTLNTPATPGSDRVTWQGQAMPVVARTWGSIKALYR